MSDTDQPSNLPAQIAAAVAGIPAALVPACVKALDRLIGAAVDIPVAWLEHQKAKIVSETEVFRTIDGAITVKAATKAGSNEHFADRALDNLVRKSYRQLDNKEAVSAAMIEELRNDPSDPGVNPEQNSNADPANIDDDWLNVFERYAEDASTERMQRLWGRVLAGAVRTPGQYGMRTLRFLSEFSQADALTFSQFCKSSFGDLAPKSLVLPEGTKDMRSLIYMEPSGLIQGSTGTGLSVTKTFDENGRSFLQEGKLLVVLNGEARTTIQYPVVALTPLGQELVTLLPGRDAREAARAVAEAIKTPQIKSASLMILAADNSAIPMEILWQEEAPTVTSDGENPTIDVASAGTSG